VRNATLRNILRNDRDVFEDVTDVEVMEDERVMGMLPTGVKVSATPHEAPSTSLCWLCTRAPAARCKKCMVDICNRCYCKCGRKAFFYEGYCRWSGCTAIGKQKCSSCEEWLCEGHVDRCEMCNWDGKPLVAPRALREDQVD